MPAIFCFGKAREVLMPILAYKVADRPGRGANDKGVRRCIAVIS